MAKHQPENVQDAHKASGNGNHAKDETGSTSCQHIAASSSEPPSHQSVMFQLSAAGVAAQKVFDTCEMLEEILSYLDPVDMLETIGVQHSWKDTIENSTRLRRLLGLAPGGKFFYSPFLGSSIGDYSTHHEISHILDREWKDHSVGIGLVGLRRGFKFPVADNDSEYMVCFEFVHNVGNPRYRWLRQYGRRVREMAICNPPLQSICARLECQNCSEQPEDEPGTELTYIDYTPIVSTSERGVTVGDLADRFASLAKTEHLECKTRSFFGHGCVGLRDDDPIVKSWASHQERAKLKKREVGRDEDEHEDDNDDDDVEEWSEQSSEHNTESERSDDDEYDEDRLGMDEDGWDETKEERAQLIWQTANAGKGARTDINEQDFNRLKALIESTYSNATLTRRTPHAEEELEWSVSPAAKSRGGAEDAEVDRDGAEPAV